MQGTIESIRQKVERTEELGSVVHTMKSLAASKIGQYEASVRSLQGYYQTLVWGISVALQNHGPGFASEPRHGHTGVIVMGSDQGLVGQFNELLGEFLLEQLPKLPGECRFWVVGERMNGRLLEAGLQVEQVYRVPHSVRAIAPLIGQLILDVQVSPLYVFHNQPMGGAVCEPKMDRMLPLDTQWLQEMQSIPWITGNLPEILGDSLTTLQALVREYLYVILFRACAESLSAENTSRLAAMQRAEKNIGEILEKLRFTYHKIRQDTIDEELFDIVAGYEALVKEGEGEF